MIRFCELLQATELSAASASPAAWCLAGYADEAVGRTTAVRDALYGSLLAALQLRLAEVCQHCADTPFIPLCYGIGQSMAFKPSSAVFLSSHMVVNH